MNYRFRGRLENSERDNCNFRHFNPAESETGFVLGTFFSGHPETERALRPLHCLSPAPVYLFDSCSFGGHSSEAKTLET